MLVYQRAVSKLVFNFTTYFGDLQPTCIGVIIHLLSAMDIPVNSQFAHWKFCQLPPQKKKELVFPFGNRANLLKPQVANKSSFRTEWYKVIFSGTFTITPLKINMTMEKQQFQDVNLLKKNGGFSMFTLVFAGLVLGTSLPSRPKHVAPWSTWVFRAFRETCNGPRCVVAPWPWGSYDLSWWKWIWPVGWAAARRLGNQQLGFGCFWKLTRHGGVVSLNKSGFFFCLVKWRFVVICVNWGLKELLNEDVFEQKV